MLPSNFPIFQFKQLQSSNSWRKTLKVKITVHIYSTLYQSNYNDNENNALDFNATSFRLFI